MFLPHHWAEWKAEMEMALTKNEKERKSIPLDASGKTSCALYCLLSPARRSVRTAFWQPCMYICIHGVVSTWLKSTVCNLDCTVGLTSLPFRQMWSMDKFTPCGNKSSGECKLLQKINFTLTFVSKMSPFVSLSMNKPIGNRRMF